MTKVRGRPLRPQRQQLRLPPPPHQCHAQGDVHPRRGRARRQRRVRIRSSVSQTGSLWPTTKKAGYRITKSWCGSFAASACITSLRIFEQQSPNERPLNGLRVRGLTIEAKNRCRVAAETGLFPRRKWGAKSFWPRGRLRK